MWILLIFRDIIHSDSIVRGFTYLWSINQGSMQPAARGRSSGVVSDGVGGRCHVLILGGGLVVRLNKEATRDNTWHEHFTCCEICYGKPYWQHNWWFVTREVNVKAAIGCKQKKFWQRMTTWAVSLKNEASILFGQFIYVDPFLCAFSLDYYRYSSWHEMVHKVCPG